MKTMMLISLTLGALAVGAVDTGGFRDDGRREGGPGEPEGREGLRSAVFAGGCFWCTVSDFQQVPGVVEVVAGYTGGRVPDPSYEEVSSGDTGHLEAIRVLYDPKLIDYDFLLDWFWRHVDPTDGGGSFVDRGEQYVSAIFYADEEQKRRAEASKARLKAAAVFDRPVVTPILPLGDFYEAEEHHQDYHREHAMRYEFYRFRSGRDDFLDRVWGERRDSLCPVLSGGCVKPGEAELSERLTPLQYKVTQEEGTERPFDNAYWDNHAEGIYVDLVSGEALFGSRDKFDSGTGWPSFTRPLEPGNIVTRKDRKLFTVRTEVRSRMGDNHLGHVFEDGPAPTGLRYCLNSAALRFIARDDLEKEGYAEYRSLFE